MISLNNQISLTITNNFLYENHLFYFISHPPIYVFTVECAAGTYNKQGKGKCTPCVKGEYTPNTASIKCSSCSSKMTTANSGSTSHYHCFQKLGKYSQCH